MWEMEIVRLVAHGAWMIMDGHLGSIRMPLLHEEPQRGNEGWNMMELRFGIA